MVDARSAAFRRFEGALLNQPTRPCPVGPNGFRKAAKLLYAHLTPEQRDSICTVGFIQFKTAAQRNYEIGYGHGNHKRSYFVSERTRWGSRSYCIAPVAAVPYPDLFLIHLWSLQADESGWRKTAVPV